MQKKTTIFLFCLGLAALGIMFGRNPPTHKVDWCHFPPGQRLGDRSGSKYQILSIDVAADGTPTDGQHLTHKGEGPVLVLGSACATDYGTTDVWGTAWGDLVDSNGNLLYKGQLPLIPGTKTYKGQCVCPAGTVDEF